MKKLCLLFLMLGGPMFFSQEGISLADINALWDVATTIPKHKPSTPVFCTDNNRGLRQFGTDFSINLLWANSYSEYYNIYCDNLGADDPGLAKIFGSINPEKYLFNEI
jgi:hypothetical protein